MRVEWPSDGPGISARLLGWTCAFPQTHMLVNTEHYTVDVLGYMVVCEEAGISMGSPTLPPPDDHYVFLPSCSLRYDVNLRRMASA